MESKKNKENDKDENRAVKLKFTLTFDWIDGKSRVAEVVSRSVLNSECFFILFCYVCLFAVSYSTTLCCISHP